jgi:hypothetical protein
MRRVLLGLAACALGLGLSGTAQAREHGRPARGHEVRVVRHEARPYYRDHGHAFRGGYYYAGHQHPHWGYKVWDARYNRYNYWDADLHCFYYWYAPGSCWYPVTYCP